MVIKNESKHYSIGVDLGGTNTVYAVVDEYGNIIDKNSFTTSTSTAMTWADILADGIKDMVARLGIAEQICGIGIGAPSANAASGCIEGATNLPWAPPIPLAVV